MDQIPTEILCEILSYLDTYDLLQFCRAYGNNCFLKESSIVRKVDFSRRFELKDINLYALINIDFNYTHIKILNIDNLYWIPVADLRKLINQLENLEELHAVHTELGLKEDDIFEYEKISDEDPTFVGIHYENIVRLLKNLEKVVIKSKIPVPGYDFEDQGLTLTFECRRHGPGTDLIFEKIGQTPKHTSVTEPHVPSSEPKRSETEDALGVFYTLLHDLAYGPKESKQVCIQKCLNNTRLEELNFCQPNIFCNLKYISCAMKILTSKHSRELKKLRLRACMFGSSQTEAADKGDLKSPRQRSSTKHPFWKISENIANLRELELEACPQCNDEIVMSAYSAIQKFEHLNKLSLEVPSQLDGSFLKEVFTKCRRLESLHLVCVVKNQTFMSNLCDNLKYATSLKHFRLHHRDIVLNKLLDTLNALEPKNLIRIYISCDTVKLLHNSASANPLCTFVKDNPQLVLLVICRKESNKTLEKYQQELATFIHANRARIFWVNARSVPHNSAHHDIFFDSTNVSVVNVHEF
ncbi:hypothetical protein NQ318_007935 [Aromia moschata]|uniref:F-box domain-containing protein n=1 Tax=Aromia moschata TaxID=1265417 RepID=A0AAV8Y0M2_9CUCU|nr:hypothetical protein NQ318_007935 [Aromia moschata]